MSGLDLSQPLDGEAIWHADMTYTERPPMAAILYRTQIRAGASAVP